MSIFELPPPPSKCRESGSQETAISVATTLRVLVATNMYPHVEDPASGSFVQAQVSGLKDLGCVVDVLHIRGDRSTVEYLKAIRQVRARVREFLPDVVYAFYGLTGWVTLWQPAPFVLSLAGDDILGTPDGRGGRTLKSKAGILLSQWAAAYADSVCVQSQEMRDKLWGRKLRARAHVVPYGVDPSRFHPGDRAGARSRLGLPQEPLIALFPNTPTVLRKRLDLAKSAIELARERLPNLELLVVSKVPHAAMPDYYRAADCCLITSDWEGSPNVVKEALLSGLSVVSTDVGDVKEWLALSTQSRVCDRTPEAVADALVSVLSPPRRVDPTPFVERFSSRAVTARMVDLFNTIRQQHTSRL